MRLRYHSPSAGSDRHAATTGFTLVEVLVALVICVVFGAAAFATNSQLLLKLRAQKETTAATMLLQRRMEQLRASAWSDLATASYLQTSILADPPPDNPNLTQQQIAAYLATLKNAEAPLSGIAERISVSVYPPDAGPSGVAERNSSSPTGQIISNISGNPAETPTTVYSYLTSAPKNATLLRVDILLTWDGAGSRGARRGRQLSSVFGIGNIAP
jgi:prepilin-type N-terminal cleavage/methylation domain-containing protein